MPHGHRRPITKPDKASLSTTRRDAISRWLWDIGRMETSDGKKEETMTRNNPWAEGDDCACVFLLGCGCRRRGALRCNGGRPPVWQGAQNFLSAFWTTKRQVKEGRKEENVSNGQHQRVHGPVVWEGTWSLPTLLDHEPFDNAHWMKAHNANNERSEKT